MAEGYSVEAYLSATGVSEFEKGFKKAEDSTKGLDKSIMKADVSVGTLLKTFGGMTLITKTFQSMTGAMDSAITRYDTLNSFPKVMEGLGFSTEEAEGAMTELSDGIDGLPTKLDDIVGSTQRLATMTGDLDGASKAAVALNNAFISSGSGAADASRGTQQYLDMIGRGEADLTGFRTLQETMPIALNKVAESFKFTGDSAQNDLYDALADGSITFSDFNDRIIELNEGVGGFAELARTSSGGIRTAWSNMTTAFSRGTANVITAIDEFLSANGLGQIENQVKSIQGVIDTFYKTAVTYVPIVGQHIMNLVNWLRTANGPLLGIITSIAGFVAVIALANSGLRMVSSAMSVVYGLLMVNPIVLIVAAVAGLAAGLYVLYQRNEAVRNTLNELYNSISGFVLPIFESLKNTINDTIVPAFDTLKEKISEVTGVFKQSMDEQADATNQFSLILSGILGVVEEYIPGFYTTMTTFWDNAAKPILDVIPTVNANIATLFSDSLTTITDEQLPVKDKLEELWDGYANYITETIPVVNSAVGQMFQGLSTTIEENKQPFAESVSGIFSGITDTISQAVPNLLPAIQSILGGLLTYFVEMGKNIINDVMGWFGLIGTWWAEDGEMIISGLQNLWSKIEPLIGPVLDFIIQIVKWLGAATWDAIDGFVTSLIGFITGIASFIGYILNGEYISALKELPGIIWNAIKGIWYVLEIGFLRGLGSLAIKILGPILKPFKGIIKWLTETFSPGFLKNTSGESGPLAKFVSFIKGGLTIAMNIFNNLFKSVLKPIDDLWIGVRNMKDKVVGFVKQLGSDIKGHLGEIFETIINMAKNRFLSWFSGTFWKKITGFIPALIIFLGSVVTSVREAIPKFKKAAVDTIQGWITGASEKVSSATAFIGEFRTKATDAIRRLITRFKTAGKDVIGGLVSGLKEKVGGAVDTVKGFGSDLLDGFKGVLGIKSPSKEFEQSGIWIIDGLLGGVLNNAGQVTASLKSLAGDAINAFNGSAVGLSTGLDDSTNSENEALLENLKQYKKIIQEFKQQQALERKQQAAHSKYNNVSKDVRNLSNTQKQHMPSMPERTAPNQIVEVDNKFEINGTEYKAFVKDISNESNKQSNRRRRLGGAH